MGTREFELIKTFFSDACSSPAVELGIGDDAAVLRINPKTNLVTTTDTLVEKTHFPKHAPPDALACKAVAVNLSDLAAMGATPLGFTLALTLPEVDTAWLTPFAQTLLERAAQYSMPLIGGDTTQGPLSITIQAYGTVPKGTYLTRSGAQTGDTIYVSGTLGNAGYALQLLDDGKLENDYWFDAYYKPQPRIALGQQLLTLASSAIDISDGLVADLEKIAQASRVGAKIWIEQLPISDHLCAVTSQNKSWDFALTAGDDYELCFTVPPAKEHLLAGIGNRLGCALTAIGTMEGKPTVEAKDKNGHIYPVNQKGFEHFRDMESGAQ